MHYEDQARQFNLLSGFLFGAVVGVGLVLLSGPIRQFELPRRQRTRREILTGQLDTLRGEAARAARSAIEAGADRLRG
jgi:hypothetical protein